VKQIRGILNKNGHDVDEERLNQAVKYSFMDPESKPGYPTPGDGLMHNEWPKS